MSARPRVLLELGAELDRVARETLAPDAGRLARLQAASRWRTLPVALLVVLSGGAAVAFASGLISFGSPVAGTPVFAKPEAGLGTVVPGSVRLLPISASDPNGGSPWGMRVLDTTRGVGCIQVGRLVDGKLVALGQDGAFDDDGLAHALPPSAGVERRKCTLLDGRGDIFDSVTSKTEPASAAPGEHCVPPGKYGHSRAAKLPTCPLADERELFYGMLGPEAMSITYRVEGDTRTVPTVGSDGAYLIVTKGTTHRFTGAAGRRERDGLDTSDAVPVYGPITAIHYRGGAVCHLTTAAKWVYGRRACSPTLSEPYGYVKPTIPTVAQLATPIHARAARVRIHPPIHVRDARVRKALALIVSFRSRVAISTLRGEYDLRLHRPGTSREVFLSAPLGPGAGGYSEGLIPATADIAAGQTITQKILLALPGGPLPHPGIATGEVLLDFTVGPLIQTAEDTTKIPVGHVSVRLP